MKVILCAAALVVASITVGAGADERPNFTGTWTVVPDRSIWYKDDIPVNIRVFGERFTIEQTDERLTVAIDNEQGFTWVHRLDGMPERNLPPGPDGPQEVFSTAVWTDSALLITLAEASQPELGPRAAGNLRRLAFNGDETLRVEASWGRNGGMIASVYARSR
jgi:hypothetical protein